MRNVESGLLTVARCAELLNVSPDSIYRAIDAGRLPAYRGPGGLRIAIADLQRSMARWRTTDREGV